MHLTNNNPNCGIIEITLHTTCNFKCSYCDPVNYDGKYRWKDDFTPYLNIINDFKKRNKYVIVSLLGGEPTLMPGFNDLLETVVSENTLVSFSTNASRTIRYWEDFKPGPYLMELSWHSEEINDDHYVKVAEIMSSKCEVDAELLVVPKVFERAKLLHARLAAANVTVSPKLVRLNIMKEGYFPYTLEQKQWIQSSKVLNHKKDFFKWHMPSKVKIDGVPLNWVDMQVAKENKFTGWKCNSGLTRLTVNASGEVRGCSTGAGQSFGNIFTGYTLPDTPMICDVDYCNCFFDVLIEKWNDK